MSLPLSRTARCLLPLLAMASAHAQEAQAPSLKEVVITGTRTEREIEDVPVRTEVVTREEIERTHAGTLKEALENVPGLQLREVVGKSGYELSLQGLTSDQVLVLIDGLPITASTGSTVDLSQYLLSDVERIEVVKGASSAQYGSSAMGGVVNVITRSQPAGFGGTVAVEAGSYGKQNDSGRKMSANNQRGRFQVGGGGEKWRLALSGDRQDDAGFGVNPSAYPRQGDASLRQQIAARAEWLPTSQGRAWVDASHYTEDDTQRYNQYVPPVNVPQRKQENIKRDRVSGGVNWRFDNGIRAQVTGVHERYNSHSPGYSNEVLATNRTSRQRMQHMSTQIDLPAWGKQLWTFGTDWHHETLGQTSNGVNELNTAGNAKRSSTEVFVQNNVLLSEDLELLFGLRGQRDSDFGSHWAPKVGLRANVWQGSEWKSTVRASIGQGYRVPNLKERHYLFDHSTLGYRVIGNPGLKPESSTSLQLGATFKRGEQLAVDFNAFYNRLRDLIQIDEARATVTDGIANYTYANVARARTSGLDSSVTWRASRVLSLSAAHTFTATRNEATGRELTRRPKQILRLGADWRIQPETVLALRVRSQSSELVDTATRKRSPAWTTVDLSLNHQIGRSVTLFAGVSNLTNRQRSFTNASDFGPVAGRYLYLGAKFALGNASR